MSDDFPNRESIRLKGFDYSRNGYYFVTICTQNMENLFGEITDGKMVLSGVGKIVERCIFEIVKKFPNTKIDVYQIMPNHIHMIIKIVGAPLVGARFNEKTTRNNQRVGVVRAVTRAALTLGDIVGAFKSLITDEYIEGVKNNLLPKFHYRLFQRNYYDHIIRSEREYKQMFFWVETGFF